MSPINNDIEDNPSGVSPYDPYVLGEVMAHDHFEQLGNSNDLWAWSPSAENSWTFPSPGQDPPLSSLCGGDQIAALSPNGHSLVSAPTDKVCPDLDKSYETAPPLADESMFDSSINFDMILPHALDNPMISSSSQASHRPEDDGPRPTSYGLQIGSPMYSTATDERRKSFDWREFLDDEGHQSVLKSLFELHLPMAQILETANERLGLGCHKVELFRRKVKGHKAFSKYLRGYAKKLDESRLLSFLADGKTRREIMTETKCNEGTFWRKFAKLPSDQQARYSHLIQRRRLLSHETFLKDLKNGMSRSAIMEAGNWTEAAVTRHWQQLPRNEKSRFSNTYFDEVHRRASRTSLSQHKEDRVETSEGKVIAPAIPADEDKFMLNHTLEGADLHFAQNSLPPDSWPSDFGPLDSSVFEHPWACDTQLCTRTTDGSWDTPLLVNGVWQFGPNVPEMSSTADPMSETRLLERRDEQCPGVSPGAGGQHAELSTSAGEQASQVFGMGRSAKCQKRRLRWTVTRRFLDDKEHVAVMKNLFEAGLVAAEVHKQLTAEHGLKSSLDTFKKSLGEREEFMEYVRGRSRHWFGREDLLSLLADGKTIDDICQELSIEKWRVKRLWTGLGWEERAKYPYPEEYTLEHLVDDLESGKSRLEIAEEQGIEKKRIGHLFGTLSEANKLQFADSYYRGDANGNLKLLRSRVKKRGLQSLRGASKDSKE